MGVVGVPDAGDAEVGEVEVALNIKDEVFGLDIAMDDSVVVDVFESGHDAGHKEA